MRSKSPLALMEQVIMVLVFALAAALCLRVFAELPILVILSGIVIEVRPVQQEKASSPILVTGLPL